MRKRLADEKAKFLGIKPRPKDKGNRNPKYSISEEQEEKLRIEFNEDTSTSANDYQEERFYLSALNKEENKILTIYEFCDKYNLKKEDVSSYKFLPYHYKEPSYNIVFKESTLDNEMDWNEVKKVLSKELKREYVYKPKSFTKNKENVLKWSDLHFGAYIRNTLLVHDFDKDILLDGLLESIDVVNDFGFKKTHIHINGDLIESFSGLNHINSWQSMDSEIIGANAVKLCAKMLHKALSKVNNLGCVKIVAGNHDRTSKNNDEDVKGGAADLIAYCLELMGYDVEFHPYVITHFVDGINHINLHGDKGISKKSTEKIILDYGIQGEYNLINEGHLHSAIEKLSIRQRESFDLVKDDSILHRRFYLPSFFTGNYYSATLGFTTNPGYYSIWNNGKNKPQFFNGSV